VSHVGVDLAWGSRARSGIAVVDRDGRLISAASVLTDEEILAVIRSQVARGDVVAFDAPLIVTNDSGARACERALARDFARFGAGPHPTNLGRPHMHPEPRAMRLARQAGLTSDPRARFTGREPVAIEVYPHPAMVSWFSLSTIIPYKAKAGRDVAARQEAFTSLLRHVLRFLGGPMDLSHSPDWERLVHEVAIATRHVQLNRAEDELDAICCAHLAWLWATQPGDLAVYGDAQGFIVTPRPPAPQAGNRRNQAVSARHSSSPVD